MHPVGSAVLLAILICALAFLTLDTFFPSFLSYGGEPQPEPPLEHLRDLLRSWEEPTTGNRLFPRSETTREEAPGAASEE